jgi:beta-galactosidase GanA
MVQFVKMQADILHERCPQHPVTVTMRAFLRKFDHFDMADVADFVSIESNVVVKG